MLIDKQITELIKQNHIGICPSPDFDTALGPVSLDLRLGNRFGSYTASRTLDMQAERKVEWITAHDYFILVPGKPVLAHTEERVTLSNRVAARVEGRSTAARLFISVHQDAAVIEPGFDGQIVLEMSVIGKPVIVYPGDRICALTFYWLSDEPARPFRRYPGTKYAGGVSGAIPDRMDVHASS